jgi:hypothetical protein
MEYQILASLAAVPLSAAQGLGDIGGHECQAECQNGRNGAVSLKSREIIHFLKFCLTFITGIVIELKLAKID